MRFRAAIVPILALAFVALLPVAPAGAGGFCLGHSAGDKFTDTDGTEVVMAAYCFTPTVIRVAAGDTVTWTNNDKEVHAVGGSAGTFGDGHKEIAPGDSVSYRFDQEGTFPYVCIYHPGMSGAVVVGDGEGPAFTAGGIVVAGYGDGNDGTATTEGSQPTTSTADDGESFPWLEAITIALALGVAAFLILGALRRHRQAETKPI